MVASLKRKYNAFRNNRDLNNVFYSLLSYFITPFVLIISTPLLLLHLGASNYGLWILINSVIAIMTMSNFGLGNAMIKLGSEYVEDSRKSRAEFNKLYSITLMIAVMVSIVIMLLLVTCGQYLLNLIFGGDHTNQLMSISYYLGGVAVLRLINSVISGTYMAKQRFDLNSKVNIIINLSSSIAFTVLAVYFASLYWLVIALFVSSVVLLILNFFIARKMVPGLSFVFARDKIMFKRVTSYGFYSWSQALNVTLSGHADKLIIGGMLGTHALGVYTVCMQLVFKLHEIPVAAGGFLLARFTGLYETGDRQQIKTLYRKAVLIKSLFIVVIGGLLVLFSKRILSLWIGAEFANQNYQLFNYLVAAIAVGAFGVIPYYCLNGTRFERMNTIVAYLMMIANIGFLPILIPIFGLNGAAVAKVLRLPFVVYSFYYVEKNVINEKREGLPREVNSLVN